MLSKCFYRRHSVRSGKKTSVILAGLSLRGNRTMRSFLEAVWEHSENLPPQTSPNHLCETIFVLPKWGQSLRKKWHSKKKNNGTKLLNSADMSWFGLFHIISEELATATFMETDQNELRFPKGILNAAQTVTKAVQPQKAKHSHSAATM